MRSGALALADPAATRRIGHVLAGQLAGGDVVLLAGEVGAGKTSLARGVLEGLGVTGEVPSPSFALVLEYRPPDARVPVLHVDLYRIDDPHELMELGLDPPDPGTALLVEWPERAGPGAWPDALRLSLGIERGGRCLTWEAPPSWEARWPPPRS